MAFKKRIQAKRIITKDQPNTKYFEMYEPLYDWVNEIIMNEGFITSDHLI